MVSHKLLLTRAIDLVPTYGFTRTALAQSIISYKQSQNQVVPDTEPSSDLAVTALFGSGDDARRTLINAWLEDGVHSMRSFGSDKSPPPSLRDVLQHRLKKNEPVLQHLPEAYALLATSSLVSLDPRPALSHAFTVADEACHASKDESLLLSWYSRRASIAAVYTTAELHQMTSPNTAPAFLDSLLQSSSNLASVADGVALYSEYIFKSWKGILKSTGAL